MTSSAYHLLCHPLFVHVFVFWQAIKTIENDRDVPSLECTYVLRKFYN